MKSSNHFENLKMALEWDRQDLAKRYILTGEEEFTVNQLNELMEIALIHNKPKFVELILEMGLDFHSFLTLRRLTFLYNSLKVIVNHLTFNNAWFQILMKLFFSCTRWIRTRHYIIYLRKNIVTKASPSYLLNH